jgi:hypothetical protein
VLFVCVPSDLGGMNELKQRPRLLRSRGSAESLREGFFATEEKESAPQSTPVYVKPSNLIRRRNADVAL